MLMIRFLMVIGFLMAGYHLAAEPNKQALKFIREENFGKAADQVQKSLEKDSVNPAGNYLAGLLHIQPTFENYDPDTAYFHARKAEDQWLLIDEKEKQKLFRIEINLDSILQLRTRIESAAFNLAVEAMSLNSFRDFFAVYDNDSLDIILTTKRDSLAYSVALKDNTWESYRDYLENYPQSRYFNQAESSYHRLIYEKKAKGKSAGVIENFLSDIPDTPYRNALEKELLKQYTLLNEPSSYLHFLKKYPRSVHKKLVADILFYLAQSDSSFTFPQFLMSDSLKSVLKRSDQELVPFYENRKYGFFDLETGKTILPPKFSAIDRNYLCGVVDKDILWVEVNDTSQLISTSGVRIFSPLDDYRKLSEGVFQVGRGELNGVILANGETILPVFYDRVGMINSQLVYGIKDEVFELYSYLGHLLLRGNFDEVYHVGGRVLALERAEKIALIDVGDIAKFDRNGSHIDFLYDDFEVYNHRYIIGFSKEAEVLLNFDLEELIPLGIHEIFVEGDYAYTRSKWGYKIYDFEERKLNDDLYSGILAGVGKIAVKKNNHWNLFYEQKNAQPELNIDSVYFPNDRVSAISRSGERFLLFDDHKKIVLEPEDYVTAVIRSPEREKTEYLAIKNKKDDIRLISGSGKNVLEVKGDLIEAVTDSIFLLKNKDGVTLVNEQGERLLKKYYSLIEPERNEKGLYFHLLDKGKLGIFVYDEDLLIEPAYDEKIRVINDAFHLVTMGSSIALVKRGSKQEKEFKYEEASILNDSLVLLKEQDRWMLQNISSGENILTGIVHLDKAVDYGSFRQMKFRQESGYGLLDSRKGVFLSGLYNEISVIGSRDKPYIFTERFLKDSEFYIVLYFDSLGNKLGSFAYSSAEYDNILCE